MRRHEQSPRGADDLRSGASGRERGFASASSSTSTSPWNDDVGPEIFDSVHGPVALHPASYALIATREFQRLKSLKQVGAGYWVFPAASNNRYEHCIGTAHLARTLAFQLSRQTSPVVPQLTKQDLLCVEIAALSHDLGHGPFSHTFEGFLDEVCTKENHPRHEETSVRMFRYTLEQHENVRKMLEAEQFNEKDLLFIEELIAGPRDKRQLSKLKGSKHYWPYRGRPKEKAFLYEIVANHWNAIDVDKWDYLARDCHATGRTNKFSFERVLRTVKALPLPDGQWRLCFDESGLYDVFAMFSQRGFMHHTVYNCWKKNAIEAMLIEAWTAMDDIYYPPSESGPAIRLSDSVKYPEVFVSLTDTIIEVMLERAVDHPGLAKCHRLLHNIRTGNLYPFVGSFWLPSNISAKPRLDEFKAGILRIAVRGSSSARTAEALREFLSDDEVTGNGPNNHNDTSGGGGSYQDSMHPSHGRDAADSVGRGRIRDYLQRAHSHIVLTPRDAHHIEKLVHDAWPWIRMGYFEGTKTQSEEIYVYSKSSPMEPRPVATEVVAAFVEPIYTYDHVQVFARNECEIELPVLKEALAKFCRRNGFQLSPQGQTCE